MQHRIDVGTWQGEEGEEAKHESRVSMMAPVLYGIGLHGTEAISAWWWESEVEQGGGGV